MTFAIGKKISLPPHVVEDSEKQPHGNVTASRAFISVILSLGSSSSLNFLLMEKQDGYQYLQVYLPRNHCSKEDTFPPCRHLRVVLIIPVWPLVHPWSSQNSEIHGYLCLGYGYTGSESGIPSTNLKKKKTRISIPDGIVYIWVGKKE